MSEIVSNALHMAPDGAGILRFFLVPVFIHTRLSVFSFYPCPHASGLVSPDAAFLSTLVVFWCLLPFCLPACGHDAHQVMGSQLRILGVTFDQSESAWHCSHHCGLTEVSRSGLDDF